MSTSVLTVRKDDIGRGQVRRYDANGNAIAVYNVEGRFFATQDGCTHATASLSEGDIVDEDCIACPVHGGTFHIPSGQAMSFPCEHAIRTYKVMEQIDVIRIQLDQESDEAAQSI